MGCLYTESETTKTTEISPNYLKFADSSSDYETVITAAGVNTQYKMKDLELTGDNTTLSTMQPFSSTNTMDFKMTVMFSMNPSAQENTQATLIECFNDVSGSYDGLVIKTNDDNTGIQILLGDNSNVLYLDDAIPVLFTWTKIGDTSFITWQCGTSTSGSCSCTHTVNFDNPIRLGAANIGGTITRKVTNATIDYLKIEFL